MTTITDKEIAETLAKVQTYLKTHPKAITGLTVEGNKNYGVAGYSFSLPADFPLNGKNQKEVAIFVHALYGEDKSLTIPRVSYNKDGVPSFEIQTRHYIGDNDKDTFADETKEMQPLTDAMTLHIKKALSSIAGKKEPALRHEIQQSFQREQQHIDRAYAVTREATAKAFKENDHVVVFGDQLVDQKFVFQFRAALDGAANVAGLAAVRLNTSTSSFDFFSKNPDRYAYGDVVNQASALKQKNGIDLIGDYNHYEDKSQWNVLSNAEKAVIVHKEYRQNYDDIQHVDDQYAGKKTLNLMTDFPPTEGAVVLNGAKDITTTKRKEYYTMRFNDGQPAGPHSEEALKSRYPAPDGKTNIDISGGNDEQVLYYSVEMGRSMYEHAKLHYVGTHAAKGHKAQVTHDHGFDEKNHSHTAPNGGHTGKHKQTGTDTPSH